MHRHGNIPADEAAQNPRITGARGTHTRWLTGDLADEKNQDEDVTAMATGGRKAGSTAGAAARQVRQHGRCGSTAGAAVRDATGMQVDM